MENKVIIFHVYSLIMRGHLRFGLILDLSTLYIFVGPLIFYDTVTVMIYIKLFEEVSQTEAKDMKEGRKKGEKGKWLKLMWNRGSPVSGDKSLSLGTIGSRDG